ncbi:MAG: PaaI family thioesterase, partial [Anaerolineales bacterium]|nr:PaaI family thioesterase [Anaerolineales bacterium]
AIPGYVYGGLIASLIDCHSTGSAAAAFAKAKNINLEHEPAPRFVTASLKVDYLKPTPLGPPLELRARIVEVTERKVIVHTTLSANGDVCAKGEVIAVLMPENLIK